MNETITQQQSNGSGKAVASLVLGIIGMIAWLIPFFGFPITITGLVLGNKALNGPGHGMAQAGVILCIVGIVLTVISALIGFFSGM